jgi:hypothetical protein
LSSQVDASCKASQLDRTRDDATAGQLDRIRDDATGTSE